MKLALDGALTNAYLYNSKLEIRVWWTDDWSNDATYNRTRYGGDNNINRDEPPDKMKKTWVENTVELGIALQNDHKYNPYHWSSFSYVMACPSWENIKQGSKSENTNCIKTM